jgi:hypothetical protein
MDDHHFGYIIKLKEKKEPSTGCLHKPKKNLKDGDGNPNRSQRMIVHSWYVQMRLFIVGTFKCDFSDDIFLIQFLA